MKYDPKTILVFSFAAIAFSAYVVGVKHGSAAASERLAVVEKQRDGLLSTLEKTTESLTKTTANLTKCLDREEANMARP